MSLAMKLTTTALHGLRKISRNKSDDPDALVQALDPHREPLGPPRSLLKFGTVTESENHGSVSWRFVPRHAREGLEILYLPGGGYVNPANAPHWWIVRRLAEKTGGAVTLATYPLAPENTVAETTRAVDAAWAKLSALPGTRWKIAAGDSAGGHAALSLSLRNLDDPERRPDGVIAIAPWIDLTMTNPAALERERLDPMLRVARLQHASKLWAHPHGSDHPTLSLSAAHVAHFPPTLIAQGRYDIFYDDVVAFSKALNAATGTVTLLDEPDGFHVYPAAFWTPESKRAFTAISDFVNERVTGVTSRA